MSPENNDIPNYDEIFTSDNDNTNKDVNFNQYSQSNSLKFSKEYGDLLPSFEMHNSMFNRTLNEDVAPGYQESLNETVISSNCISDSIPSTSDMTLNSNDFVLNNLHKLQKIDLPFEVNVTLTKNSLNVGTPYEKENPLRQYYPGEMVYGFITFENKSKVDLPFEMLLVSLEGDIGVKHPKTRDIIKKKIVIMYDLEASYNYLPVDTYCNNCNMYDPRDNTQIGFKSRVLKPGIIVKKFFKFKIPTFLLDDTCSEQFPEHLKIPPSFGLDIFAFKNGIYDLDVEPHLGYSKLQYPGSPIKVNDYVLPGEFCSYHINVQIIGKKLEIYKQFYKQNTTHSYDFIFLKNVEYHFRVGRLPESNTFKLNYGSTKNQIEAIEKIAIETQEVLTEREMLQKVNINDIYQQDEIIFSSSGKQKVALNMNPDKYIPKQPIDKSYQKSALLKFKKDLFSKLNGELVISVKMEAGATVKSFLPKLMENQLTNVPYNENYMKSAIPVANLELVFKPTDNSDKLPTSLIFKPKMIAMGVNSVFHIPFIIDDDYLLDNGDVIKQNFKKFALYYQNIGDLMKKLKVGIPKTTSALLKGMAYLRYNETIIPDIFKCHSFEFKREDWDYDSNTNSYKVSLKIPLEFNIENNVSYPKALLSTFQTCKMARLYKIQFDISPKKGKNFESYFPITVI